MSDFRISTKRDGNYVIVTVSGTPEQPDGQTIDSAVGRLNIRTVKPSDGYKFDEIASNRSAIPASKRETISFNYGEQNEFTERVLVGEGQIAATADISVGTSNNPTQFTAGASSPNKQQFNEAVDPDAFEATADEIGTVKSVGPEIIPPSEYLDSDSDEDKLKVIQNSRVKIGNLELKRVERIKGSLPFQTERNVSLSGKTYVPESDRTNWGLTIEAKVSYREMQQILNLSNPVRVTTALKSDNVEFSNIQYERVSDMDTVTVNGVRQPLYRVQLQTEEKSDDAQTSAGNIASGSIDVEE